MSGCEGDLKQQREGVCVNKSPTFIYHIWLVNSFH